MMTLIIKNLSNDLNAKFYEKSKFQVQTGNISEEPNIKKVQNANILYFDGFELIDKELYSLLFKRNNFFSLFGACYFINNSICIKMPQDLNKESNSVIFIYGYLDNHHNFSAKYLLEYNTENNFIKNFDESNNSCGFDNYINSIKFSNNNIEQLTDKNQNPIGLIYKLGNDFNNMNSNNIIFNDIREEFSMPPLIGLKSVEFIPYMNEILQILCQTEKIVNYF